MSNGADRRWYWAAVFSVLVSDLVTKLLAEANLLRSAGLRVAGDWVQLRLVYNPGAAFGLHVGPYSRWVFCRRRRRAVPHVALGSRGRLVSPVGPGSGDRWRRRQSDRSGPEPAGRRGLSRRGHRHHALAHVQRRRHRGQSGCHRSGHITLARGRRTQPVRIALRHITDPEGP